MEDEEFDVMAQVYDQMINWERRLERELPFLVSNLKPAKRILEVACSTGRHTLALAEEFEVVGIDINQKMLERAFKNISNNAERIQLIHSNILDLSKEEIGTFEGGIMLANTLANMESREGVKSCLMNLRRLIPNGKLIGQTVQLGSEIVYLPLRSCKLDDGEYLVQRVIIPLPIRQSTHQLHFNVFRNGEYFSRSIHPLFSISLNILEKIAEETGWNLTAVYGGYDGSPPKKEPGSPMIWILE